VSALQADTRPLAKRTISDMARRGRAVRIAKYALPVLGLMLLTSIAVWPEISRQIERNRATWRRLGMLADTGGEIKSPVYRGFDNQNQPYLVSAEAAVHTGVDRYDLRAPRGDLTMHNGTWLQIRSKKGVYIQHADQLDLSKDVTLYRADGTLLQTEAATMDMHKGVATSSLYTHAEGPFGTLDAEGFTLVDKGGIVQFHGPAKLVLNDVHQ
jgi:lipopolysaccharide export system protein LptC